MKPAQQSVSSAFLIIGILVAVRNDLFNQLRDWAKEPPLAGPGVGGPGFTVPGSSTRPPAGTGGGGGGGSGNFTA
jgi:hypothetical protein